MAFPSSRKVMLRRIFLITVLISATTYATVFYIDPQNGSISNNGSSAAPWSNLQDVFDSSKIESRMYETKPWEPDGVLIPKNAGAPVQPGDTLMLLSGYHGDIDAREYYNTDYITIMAQPGHSPHIAGLELRSGCKWTVHGLTISPEFAPTYIKKTLINFSSHSWTGPSYH